QADQRSGDTARRRPDSGCAGHQDGSGTSQGGHDRTRGDEEAGTGYAVRTDPDQPVEAVTDVAGCRALREFTGPRVGGKQHGDVAPWEPSDLEPPRDAFGLRLACRNTEGEDGVVEHHDLLLPLPALARCTAWPASFAYRKPRVAPFFRSNRGARTTAVRSRARAEGE